MKSKKPESKKLVTKKPETKPTKPAPVTKPRSVKAVTADVMRLSQAKRSALFDHLLESFCLVCGCPLKDGRCPKGCEAESDEEE